ncbi:PAS domain S-box protein [Methanococcoides sp. SA1]|nr:PAS domain S-box protein [Methanococcoides sp. SA1]
MKENNSFVSIEDLANKEEEKFKYLIENTSDILYIIDSDGIIHYISPQIERYGYSPALMQNTHFKDYIYPGDREKLIYDYQRMIDDRRAFTTIFRVVDNEGNPHWMESLSQYHSNKDGSSVGITGVLRDITEHKLTEEKLQTYRTQLERIVDERTAELTTANENLKNEIEDKTRVEDSLIKEKARLDSIFHVAPIGIGTIIGRNLLEVNDELCRMMGYQRSELIGQNARMFYLCDEDYNQAGKEIYSTIVEKKIATVEYQLKKKNGQIIDVLLNFALTDPNDASKGYTFTIQDITEKKLAEKIIKEKEAKNRSIFLATPIGIGVVWERVFKDVNQGFCDITGYSREELIGMDTKRCYYSEEEYNKVGTELIKLINDRQTITVETKLRKREGQIIDVLFTMALIEPDNPKTGITFTAQNITEQKKITLEKEKKERHIQSIFQATPTGIGITWARKLIDVNEKLCKMFGYSREELTDHNTEMLYPSHEEYKRVGNELKVLIDNKKPGVIESQWVHKNGNLRDIYMTFALIDVEDPSTGMTFTVQDITEKKLAEEDLYRLNQFQQTIIESADVWINVLNKDAEVVVWNNAAEAISGYSREEVIGTRNIWNYLYPKEEYRNEVFATATAIINDGKKVSGFETTITRKDGMNRVISWNSRDLIDENGNTIGSIAIGNDITKQKEAERMEKQQVHFMQELIDSIPVPIFYKDKEGIYLGCNNTFAEFTGIPKEKMVGKGVYDLYEEEIAKKYNHMNIDLIEKGGTQTYEYYLQSASGQKRAVIFNNSIFTDIEGNIAGQAGAVFDITERKEAEENQRKYAHFMQELLEAIPAPVYYKDQNGVYLGCNRAFETFSGSKREDIVGKRSYDIYDEKQAEEYNLMDHELIETGGIQIYEGQVENPDTKNRQDVVFHKSVFTDINGKTTGLIGAILDITERVRSEKMLKKYSEELEHSNELKGIFTDIMRHDLLNHATVINGYTYMLLSSEDDETKLKKLKKIDFSTKKLINLIESAAAFAKLESTNELEFEAVDIGNMISGIIENFEYQAEQKGVDIKIGLEGTFTALANPMIEEVFVNFISNALKYGSNKGDIIIKVEDADDNWKIAVTDTGEGISDKDKTVVFERFKRVGNSSIKGSGLGLAIVKRIVDLHKGKVGVENNPEGQGSVFWVTLKKA